MSLNHHILAKTVTDEVLIKFKKADWICADGCGKDFYRVGTSADFPSPDAAFYDQNKNVHISFEFKPPTESKRGILTGIGQSIAYLQNSDISFLIAPKMLEDFKIGDYLSDLYDRQISQKIPTGLILYDNNNPSQVTLEQNVDTIETKRVKRNISETSRFWAKHVDQPLPLLHLILHYYYLKKTNMIEGDPFAACWRERMISPTILDDFQTTPIKDLSGNIIMTVGGKKQMTYLEKNVQNLKGTSIDKKDQLKQMINTEFVGDNYYNSVKKNLISFLKNMQMIDSENYLTERGFKLYHIGLVNGPTSKIFKDYFTKELLTIGHHIDLLLDIDSFKQQTKTSINEIICKMEDKYENNGYIKRNPNRKSAEESRVGFLKYERILWKSLNLIDSNFSIQWKKITEICSLPDL